jgi:hypothetical protein
LSCCKEWFIAKKKKNVNIIKRKENNQTKMKENIKTNENENYKNILIFNLTGK